MDVGGVPCFAIADSEHARVAVDGKYPIWRVGVWDESSGRASSVWEYAVGSSAPPAMLGKQDCILYGRSDGNSLSGVAPMLMLNRVYTIDVNSKNASPYDPTSFYSGAFCVVSGRDGQRAVRELPSRHSACN
ncbi:MAG TPA: hypothetical protein VFK82_04030 [Burkholderiaceae bacterium]|nr:hypothetical protein [Burkholderiaceae bacterium]